MKTKCLLSYAASIITVLTLLTPALAHSKSEAIVSEKDFLGIISNHPVVQSATNHAKAVVGSKKCSSNLSKFNGVAGMEKGSAYEYELSISCRPAKKSDDSRGL